MPFVSGKCKEPRSIIPIETQYVFDGMEIGGGGPHSTSSSKTCYTSVLFGIVGKGPSALNIIQEPNRKLVDIGPNHLI